MLSAMQGKSIFRDADEIASNESGYNSKSKLSKSQKRLGQYDSCKRIMDRTELDRVDMGTSMPSFGPNSAV